MTAPQSPPLPDALQELVEDTAKRLVAEFQTRFDAHVIDQLTRESFGEYCNAKVHDYVPLFVERATRERLLAQVA